MAFLPSLRKAIAPSRRGWSPGAEVKSAGGAYFEHLRRSLSAQSGREWSPERAIREGYERIVWVYKPVNVIAANQAARRIVIRQGNSETDDDPMARLLNKRANPLETGKVFRKRLSAMQQLSKPGVFVEVSETRAGVPYRLDLLPPHRVRIVPPENTEPEALMEAGVDPRDIRALVDHYELLSADGSTARPIEPDRMRWVRDPHPMDPYSGMTPLEAAGMSVELDHFARLYNVMFLRNDGRPGGILAVKGDFDEAEEKRIAGKFEPGPRSAGKLTVISADGLDFVDPSAKPRDMNYVQLARNAKLELLASFGVPETLMGFAGDKTFANAEQERLVFWQETMVPHLDLIADGFDQDTDDDVTLAFDLSDVDVLRRIKDAELERARNEVKDGVRSPYSYAQLSGQTEVEDTIHTRSWYIMSGKQPLPINAADATTMGLDSAEEPDEQTALPTADGAPELPAGSEPATGADGEQTGAIEPPIPTGGGGAAQAALAAARTAAPGAPTGAPPSGAAAALAAARATAATPVEGKKLPIRDVPPARPVFRVAEKARSRVVTDDVDEAARDRLEADLLAVLNETAAGWVERAAARVGSVRSRKGTRHWNPQGDRPVDGRVDTKAIDPSYAVDEETWRAEAEDSVEPLLVAAAIAAATLTWQNLGGLGALPAEALRRAVSSGREVASFVGGLAARAAARLARAINDADQSGMTMDDVVAGVRDYSDRMVTWARAVSVQATTATVEAARAEGAAAIAGPDAVLMPDITDGEDIDPVEPQADVTQSWVSRRDTIVRPTHKVADGQTVPLGALFEVGDALLRHPGDPLAPLAETANCRCHLRYRSKVSGRYVANPNRRPMEAAS